MGAAWGIYGTSVEFRAAAYVCFAVARAFSLQAVFQLPQYA